MIIKNLLLISTIAICSSVGGLSLNYDNLKQLASSLLKPNYTEYAIAYSDDLVTPWIGSKPFIPRKHAAGEDYNFHTSTEMYGKNGRNWGCFYKNIQYDCEVFKVESESKDILMFDKLSDFALKQENQEVKLNKSELQKHNNNYLIKITNSLKKAIKGYEGNWLSHLVIKDLNEKDDKKIYGRLNVAFLNKFEKNKPPKITWSLQDDWYLVLKYTGDENPTSSLTNGNCQGRIPTDINITAFGFCADLKNNNNEIFKNKKAWIFEFNKTNKIDNIFRSSVFDTSFDLLDANTEKLRNTVYLLKMRENSPFSNLMTIFQGDKENINLTLNLKFLPAPDDSSSKSSSVTTSSKEMKIEDKFDVFGVAIKTSGDKLLYIN